MTLNLKSTRPSREIDPDVLDLLIQSLSILSNVATLASTWVMLRGKPGGPGTEAKRDQIRQNLRTLRRSLEDSFEAVGSVLRILEESERDVDEPELLRSNVRFGHTVLLTASEFARASKMLQDLDASSIKAKTAARNIQMLAQNSNLADSVDANFDTEGFVEQLNSILFESGSLAEAIEKLRLAQGAAEDFVTDLERSLRRN
jgi:hypothetical protein